MLSIEEPRSCYLKQVTVDTYMLVINSSNGPICMGVFNLHNEQPNGVWDQYGYRVEGKEIKYGPKEK